MPTNIVDVDEFTSPVPVPNDGEACNASSLIQFVQKLCNRTLFLKNAIANGAWIGRRLFYAPGDGSVHVGPVQGVLIAGKLCSKATDTSLTLGTLANNAWYAVYATNDGSGGITFVLDNANGPDATLTWKYASGASVTTHRFVGYFRTNASGVPRPFRAIDGRYLWRRSASAEALGSSGLNVQQPTWTNIDLSALISPASRNAILNLRVLGDAAWVRVRTEGDSTNYHEVSGTSGSAESAATIEMETNGSGVIQYQVSSSPAGVASFTCHGFIE